MKKILITLAILIPWLVSAQVDSYFGNVNADSLKATAVKLGSERDSTGVMRLDADGDSLEYYTGSAWVKVGGGGGGLADSDVDSIFYVRQNSTWVDVQNSNVTSHEDPRGYLNYWYRDLIFAHYDTDGGNANMLIIGDSYAIHVANALKNYTTDRVGFGGGYTTAYASNYYGDGDGRLNIFRYGILNWTGSTDRANPLNPTSIKVTTTTAGDSICLSTKKFNRVIINYLKTSGGGTFTVQLGINGSVLGTFDTDAVSDTTIMGVVNFGRICTFPEDTVFIYNSDGDPTTIYGYDLAHSYTPENYGDTWKRSHNTSIHTWSDGGCSAYDFYQYKDTAYISKFLNYYDISLLIFIALDAYSLQPEIHIDSLLNLFSYIKPDMSVMLLPPHDETTNKGLNQENWMEVMARENGWAYVNIFNLYGEYADLSGATMIEDGTHLSTRGDILHAHILEPILFPTYYKVWDNFTANEAKLLNSSLKFPNGNAILINSSNTVNDFTLKASKNTSLGSSSGTSLTSESLENTLIGYNTGSAITTGDYNTVTGAESGNDITEGIGNTITGYAAGRLITTGDYNTITGYGAGYDLVTGDYITLFGYNAGANIASGGKNTAIGSNSMAYADNTGENTAVGEYSLYSTTGKENTAIGVGAGQYYTTDYSTFVGFESGYGTIAAGGDPSSFSTFVGWRAGKTGTGQYATAIGSSAGSVIGERSCAFGAAALSSNTGVRNTAVGYAALIGSSSTGTHNTSVGAYSGFTAGTNTYCVYLGYEAAYDVTSGTHLYIANGQDNGAKENTWIYGNSTHDVEIPNGNLTVVGTYINTSGLITNNDATPDVTGANVWVYNGTANAVEVTDLDNPSPRAIYVIIGNSDTYTLTIRDSGNFSLAGDAVLGVGDVLTLYCAADNSYIEVSRSNN